MKYNDLALEMAEDVHTFAQEFKAKYDESVSVKIGTLKNCVIFEDKHRRLDVTEFRDIITNLMCEYNSNLSIYKSLNNRVKTLDSEKEKRQWKSLKKLSKEELEKLKNMPKYGQKSSPKKIYSKPKGKRTEYPGRGF